jgi:hypothetical protein
MDSFYSQLLVNPLVNTGIDYKNMQYKGIDSPLVDKQIMDALSDSHFNNMNVIYGNKALDQGKELRVFINNNPNNRESPTRRYNVKIEIINRPNPMEPYNAGPLVQHDAHYYPRFYASALQVKLHLARAKKQFKMATGIQNLYVNQFRVNYFHSIRGVGRNASKSHSKQATVNAIIHNHNIKKANAFRRLSLLKKVQQRFLNKYYDPSHPVGQRRLLREFETLSL